MIDKKVANILFKLEMKPPCVGCFGTKMFHINSGGELYDHCNECERTIKTVYDREYYTKSLKVYTKNCQCSWHLNYKGDLIDK